MATRTSKTAKRQGKGKVQGWGVAQANLDGTFDLLTVGFDRETIRAVKRETYPGPSYKTVKVNATFEVYTK